MGSAMTGRAQERPRVAEPILVKAFVRDLGDLRAKFLRLAAAMSPEQYSWRPGEGARSFAEVLLHAASSCFVNALFLGLPPPPGVRLGRDPRQWETSTRDRAQIIALLEQSFDHMNRLISQKTADDLGNPVTVLGQTQSLSVVVLEHIAHLHEHLGQAIAYARVNNVVPPWSH